MTNFINWGDVGVANDISRRVIRIAVRRLRRRGCLGESERLRVLGNTYRDDVKVIIAANIHKLRSYSIREILGELANFVSLSHLEAELDFRKHRGAKMNPVLSDVSDRVCDAGI